MFSATFVQPMKEHNARFSFAKEIFETCQYDLFLRYTPMFAHIFSDLIYMLMYENEIPHRFL